MRHFLIALTMAATPAAADDLLFFHSPSGNIHCMLMTGSWHGVRCDVFDLKMSFPTRPADCEQDWGHAFELDGYGRAAPACVGDTVADPNGMVLGYGQQVTLGEVTCTSLQTGMTCANTRGHGFTLARARQQLF